MLRCRRCNAEYLPDDVDLKLALAKCHACRAVADLSGRTVQIVGGSAGPLPTVERTVPRPERFKLSQTALGLEISWRWYRPMHVFLTLFATFWCGFLLVWNAIAFFTGMWPMALFSLIHVGIGVWLATTALAGLLNTTTITVARGEVHVSTAPIRFLVARNHRLTASNLEQLYCEVHRHHRKHGVSYSYSLNAVLRGGKRLQLFKNLQEVGEALWLEHELEKALDIRDRPISGEVREKVA